MVKKEQEKVQFRPNLYLSEGITDKKLDKIKKRLNGKWNRWKESPLLSGVFLISIAKNASDQLDIFDARQLVQPFYKKYPVYVIGIAESYEEALQLVERLVQECLKERGDCSLKEYLLC